MKRLLFGLFTIIAISFTSCDIKEKIVFNDDMSGSYQTTIDLGPMMRLANESMPSDPQDASKKIDTLIVFSDLLEEYKDSIATLSTEEQEKLKKLKDFTLRMNMDENEGMFLMDIGKDFNSFDELATISEDASEVMNVGKGQSSASQGASPQLDEMLKTDEVTYTFKDNVFRRVDPSLLETEESDDSIESTEEEEENPMMDQMMQEFEEMLEKSYMTLEYTFPKKVKSVSFENAKISKDKKTVTIRVDWKTLMDNDNLLKDLQITLKD